MSRQNTPLEQLHYWLAEKQMRQSILVMLILGPSGASQALGEPLSSLIYYLIRVWSVASTKSIVVASKLRQRNIRIQTSYSGTR